MTEKGFFYERIPLFKWIFISYNWVTIQTEQNNFAWQKQNVGESWQTRYPIRRCFRLGPMPRRNPYINLTGKKSLRWTVLPDNIKLLAVKIIKKARFMVIYYS
ncbi:hypothetical protein DW068_06875 [Anaerobutyricum hallii]|uniref:Uncharacterized protein n=1 Tax=Anaerobutyricum hallii TaxID=39488 RepID=A0A415G7W3_9FIRM|nr:hypothetical protein DW068_06875 [Anaerobutyricum hallii]